MARPLAGEAICWDGWPYHATRFGVMAVGKLLLKLRVEGYEHVPAAGPVVILANHESYFDPYLVSFVTPRPVVFMAKTELFEGLGGWLFPRLNTMPVKRGTGDLGAFRNAARVLKDGGVLGIFPEGTRSPDGQLQAAQPGAISIALRSGVPIVPVAVAGTYDVLPRQGGLRRAPIAVAAGAPVRFCDLPAEAHRNKQVLAAVGDWVMAEIARLKAGLQAGRVGLDEHEGERHGSERTEA